jgi:hypothetical protein
MADLLIGEEAFKWLNSISEVQFLFGEEVQIITDELFGAVFEYAMATEPIRIGNKPFNIACSDAMLKVESMRMPVERVFAPYLRPAGSPLRRQKRLTVQAAEDLLKVVQAKHDSPKQSGSDAEKSDVPF